MTDYVLLELTTFLWRPTSCWITGENGRSS